MTEGLTKNNKEDAMKGRMPAGGGRMTEDTPYTCMASSLDACVRGKDSGTWPGRRACGHLAPLCHSRSSPITNVGDNLKRESRHLPHPGPLPGEEREEEEGKDSGTWKDSRHSGVAFLAGRDYHSLVSNERETLVCRKQRASPASSSALLPAS